MEYGGKRSTEHTAHSATGTLRGWVMNLKNLPEEAAMTFCEEVRIEKKKGNIAKNESLGKTLFFLEGKSARQELSKLETK